MRESSLTRGNNGAKRGLVRLLLRAPAASCAAPKQRAENQRKHVYDLATARFATATGTHCYFSALSRVSRSAARAQHEIAAPLRRVAEPCAQMMTVTARRRRHRGVRPAAKPPATVAARRTAHDDMCGNFINRVALGNALETAASGRRTARISRERGPRRARAETNPRRTQKWLRGGPRRPRSRRRSRRAGRTVGVQWVAAEVESQTRLRASFSLSHSERLRGSDAPTASPDRSRILPA